MGEPKSGRLRARAFSVRSSLIAQSSSPTTSATQAAPPPRAVSFGSCSARFLFLRKHQLDDDAAFAARTLRLQHVTALLDVAVVWEVQPVGDPIPHGLAA